MKKFLAAAFCITLAMSLFTSCFQTSDPNRTTNQADTPGADTAAPASEQPTTVNIWFMGGNAENDDAAVVAAANARLQELGLNIAINPIWTGGWAMGDYAQVSLDTGDTNVDIYWTGSWGLNYFNNARTGNFVRLDDPNNNLLSQYGQDTIDAIPQELWDAFTTDGPSGRGLYAVPGYKDYAALFALDVNNTRLEALGFDFDDMFDMDGVNYEIIFDPRFEAAMQAAKDTYGPTFFPLFPERGNFVRHFSNIDGDLTGLDVFSFPYDPNNPALPEDPVVGLKMEDENFLRVLEKVRHFWEMGFIDPRLAIPIEAGIVIDEAHDAGEYLFSTGQYAYGHTADRQARRGIDCRYVPLGKPIVSTMSAAGSGFGISVYSQNQAAAMQFLNAWYTDNQLAVILTEGVEGIHWDFDSEGLIVPAPDRQAKYSTWRNGMGNIFILSPRDIDGYGYFEGYKAYNEAGVGTALLGFVFDSDPVALEMAALTGVVEEWRQPITVGALDLDEAVPAYIAALKANGIDRVLAELNSQLQAFYATR